MTLSTACGSSGASVRAPRALTTADGPSVADVAALANLDAADVITATHLPIFASVGAEFLFAEVRPDAIARAGGRRDRFAAMAEDLRKPFMCLYIYARTEASLDARMFAPLTGVPEDPATGSAVAALGALLHARSGLAALSVVQGVAIQRRSDIAVETSADGTWISGHCVPVMRGELML